MTQREHDVFTYRIRYDLTNGGFVGTCEEFDGLTHRGDTGDEAFNGIRQLVADQINALLDDGKPVPEPQTQTAYDELIAHFEAFGVQPSEEDMEWARKVNASGRTEEE